MRRITCRSTLAIASAVALLAGVLAGLGTVGAARAAATTCTTYHVIGARGSGEPSNGFNSMGPRVGAYAQQAAKAMPAATTVFENLPYPAQPVGPDYFQSMYSGVAMLTSELESLIANCPDTRIGLIGYSQGAQVVHMTLEEFLTSAELGHIDAVLLLADPESAPGMPYVDSPKTDGTAGTHTGGGILAEDSLPVEVSSRSTEVCIQDDPVCDSPGVTALDTAASLAFNGNIHLMYGTCCGSVDFPGIEGNNFALRMLLPLDLNGGASGELNGNIPGPPLVTSVNGLADGTILVTQDTNRVYKIVGGAPVWLSSCANNLCPNPRATTQAVIDAGPAVPRDGATASDEAGNIFKFAGGAPIHLASCAVGCGTPVPITAWSIVHFDHMRPFPSNGSTIEDESGDIFKFAGGAPIHLASCAVGCGTPVAISSASIAGLDHMRAVPADGTTIQDESGDIFKFAGGAPIHLASCAVGCGAPTAITSATIASLDHMNAVPVDGTTIQTETGTVYKLAGGSPLPLFNCKPGCGSPVGITQWSVDNRDHMNVAPAAGSFMRTYESGALFRSGQGQAVPVGECPSAVGCSSAVLVNAASIAATTGAAQSSLQANTGMLWTDGPVAGGTNTSLGMMKGTSPATTALTTGGFVQAFQANTGFLYLETPSGSINTSLGMMAGTSPAITALPNGAYEVAFQANTGNLFLLNSSTGSRDLGLGMMKGTSPAIAASPAGGYAVAFQANTGHLFVWNDATGASDTSLGMMAGTSPAIAALANVGYEAAFQANTGHAFIWNSATGGSDTTLGMMAGTSPAIAAAFTGGFQVAFQANTGYLFTWNSATGGSDTTLGMMAGTSPAITTAPGTSGYEEAFQANTGFLVTSNPTTGTTDSTLGMMTGTSPAITTSLTWLRQ